MPIIPQQKINLEKLKSVLLSAWSEETANGEWNNCCPSLNQCAATSLIVQDFFGGDLLRCLTINNVSHYWNRLPDGTEIDLTEDQFLSTKDEPIKSSYVIRTREYVLSYPDTKRRYELLLIRVMSCL